MGSTVSICNKTKCVLNIALKQITPLYYENAVEPEKCIYRDVGKVWFTLEAKLWNGENGYDTFNDIVMPITMISVAAVTVGVGGVGAIASRALAAKAAAGAAKAAAGAAKTAAVAAKVAKVTAKVFKSGMVILAVKGVDVGIKIVQEWISNYAVREYGLYMGSDRAFSITGGPRCYMDKGFQVVDYEPGDKFTLNY